MDVSERGVEGCDPTAAAKSYDFMKNMPVFNPNNFSKCSKDLMKTKVRSKYVCDVPISPDEKRIQVERTPLILKYLKNHWTVFPQKNTVNNNTSTSRRGHKRGHNELSNVECSSNDSPSDTVQLSSSSRRHHTLNSKMRHRMILNDEEEDVELSDDNENNDDVKVNSEDSQNGDSESGGRMFLKILRRNNSHSEEHNEQSADDNTEQMNCRF